MRFFFSFAVAALVGLCLTSSSSILISAQTDDMQVVPVVSGESGSGEGGASEFPPPQNHLTSPTDSIRNIFVTSPGQKGILFKNPPIAATGPQFTQMKNAIALSNEKFMRSTKTGKPYDLSKVINWQSLLTLYDRVATAKAISQGITLPKGRGLRLGKEEFLRNLHKQKLKLPKDLQLFFTDAELNKSPNIVQREVTTSSEAFADDAIADDAIADDAIADDAIADDAIPNQENEDEHFLPKFNEHRRLHRKNVGISVAVHLDEE
jgi:hypothetical protein